MNKSSKLILHGMKLIMAGRLKGRKTKYTPVPIKFYIIVRCGVYVLYLEKSGAYFRGPGS